MPGKVLCIQLTIMENHPIIFRNRADELNSERHSTIYNFLMQNQGGCNCLRELVTINLQCLELLIVSQIKDFSFISQTS